MIVSSIELMVAKYTRVSKEEAKTAPTRLQSRRKPVIVVYSIGIATTPTLCVLHPNHRAIVIVEHPCLFAYSCIDACPSFFSLLARGKYAGGMLWPRINIVHCACRYLYTLDQILSPMK